jgi:purine-binding chemotaxis protein CheW
MMEQNRESETYILFEIAGTTYGVPSQSVQQMEMIEHITPLPNAPPFVEGIVFTRGKVIPAVDLRSRFGFEKQARSNRTRLVVTNWNGRVVGLIVDSAREFISIAKNAVQPPPETMTGLSGKYLKGIVTIADRIVLIINLDELINVDQAQAAQHQA